MVNTHYNRNFEAVGMTSGDKEIDNLRFRTTNMDEHNTAKVKFGVEANPKTYCDQLAK